MPYFVYRVAPVGALTLIGEFGVYKDAKVCATAQRADQEAADRDRVRIVFAADTVEAEQLLTTPRERQPSEDD
ncbi:MAG: hypothetical protein GWN37_20490 [Gammaproteobacteria bacterium]|nr:hypothetical protein [Gammaproteobacteria bacterium]